ncbi:MAG: hypothetical protein NXI04_15940 [Planctomycetaceae bacterium]|nr:hypothetical protein [Planctomycetaceae bacterium]
MKMTNLEMALALSDAGLDLTGVIGEAFAMERFGMKPAPRRQPGFDGVLPNGRTVQVKTKGPNKDGVLPGDREYFGKVAGYNFDFFLGVQLDVNYRVWRYVFLDADALRGHITGQSQKSCNGTKDGEHYLILLTATEKELWIPGDE